jgi:hypothetical protein
MLVIPALGRYRQKNKSFKASLGYIFRFSQEKERKEGRKEGWDGGNSWITKRR